MDTLKYLNSETVFKDDAFLALCENFDSRRGRFEEYYSRISSDIKKDEFLRVSVAYLFFVKKGDWRVVVPRSDELIDYITNSFKLVALIAIIESLSTDKFEDFYQWLTKEDKFPIIDQKQLGSLYNTYKEEYGSIRKCKRFFTSLPSDVRNDLLRCIQHDRKPLEKIEWFVDLLYQARSRFAHGVDASTEFSGNHLARYRRKHVVWNLPIGKLLKAFEIGLLNHFNNK